MTYVRSSDADLPLRERKKLQAMRRIQELAIDLVERNGYEAMTIEDLAAEAEVSPSTIYRYFETKEGIFLWDEYDPPLMAGFAERLGEMGTAAAMRMAIQALVESRFAEDEPRIRRQLKLVFEIPALNNAARAQTEEFGAALAQILAVETGRPPTDLDIRVASSAVVGALIAAMEHWANTDGAQPFDQLIDETFAVLERGLEL